MTKDLFGKDLFGRDMFRDLEKSLIGFDTVFDAIAKTQKQIAQTFPPYNIRKDGENKYTIELAVAGFGKHDVEIDLEGDKLTVKGKTTEDQNGEYLFKGLANRAFTRQFTLDDQVVVNGATMVNGVLKIMLERMLPEGKKPRKINIGEESDTKKSYPEYLAESGNL